MRCVAASHLLNGIGKLKSKAGYRSIHMPPMVVQALREWKLVCPKGDLGLVFPNGLGKVESHSNILDRGLHPILISGGFTVPVPVLSDDGKPTELRSDQCIGEGDSFTEAWLGQQPTWARARSREAPSKGHRRGFEAIRSAPEYLTHYAHDGPAPCRLRSLFSERTKSDLVLRPCCAD